MPLPETHSEDVSTTAPRRWLLTVLLVGISSRGHLFPDAATLRRPRQRLTPTLPQPSRNARSASSCRLRNPHCQITGPTTAFHDSVTARYNYAFGKDTPFLPSNATSSNGQFLSALRASTPPSTAATATRRPTTSGASPFTPTASAPRGISRTSTSLIDEKGVQFSRHCEGCHNPVALLSGDLSQGMPKKRPFEEEGVTCSTCHSIHSTDTTGTGSYVMGTPAVLVDENGAPITGPVSDAEILAHLDRHSKAVMRPLYKTSEFCAACHKAAIPRALDDYKWLRAFSVYDEWQGASFTKQSPLPFYRKDSVSTCQTCHMAREAAARRLVRSRRQGRQLASHRWLGGNTLIPAYYKYDEQAAEARQLPQERPDGKGVLNVDIFALEKENAEPHPKTIRYCIAPLGLTSFSLAPGETLIADVVIQNKGIAHSLIPEQRDFYEAWVDFTVKDESGKVLAESGFIQPDGNLDPSAHSFTNRLINTKGELNDLHQIWHNRVLAYNNTHPVRPLATGPLSLPPAQRHHWPVHHHCHRQLSPLQPALHRLRRWTARRASVSRCPSSTSPPRPAPFRSATTHRSRRLPTENKEWMRWNNYGIALLDAQQYEASVQAFERVAALRPDYADAYTNMAIVEISWERYNDAKPNLAKALALLPGDPRALYYRALVERNAGQVKEAIADFEAMLATISPRPKTGCASSASSYYPAARLRRRAQRLRAAAGHRSRRPRRPLFAGHHLPPSRREREVRHRVCQVRRPERRPHRQRVRPRIPRQAS